MQDILAHWGVSNYGYGSSLLIPQIQGELGAGRPFIFRWGWWSGGGHFLVGHGLTGNSMYYMDPWFGEGAKIADYDWVVYGSNHTWTHTNILTTNPNVAPSAPANLAAVPGDEQVSLCWNRNSEQDFLRYRIYGANTANPITQVDSTTGDVTDTTKTIHNLTNGTTYYFRITAVNGGGNTSGFSNEVSATPTCCDGATGNVNVTGIVDLADLSSLVGYLTGGGYVLPCPAEANVNNAGIVDLADLSSLVSYLTGGGYVLPNCP
jgi:hypothetical protein